MAETSEKPPDNLANINIINDKLLVKQFNRGDDSAFDRIVEANSAEIAAFANQLLGWPGDVDDIIQDIFFAAFLGLKKFRCDCSIKTWLFTITINKCRSYRYKQMLRLKLFLKTAGQISLASTHAADKTMTDTETFNRIRNVVKALPPKYREPVVLKYLQEFPTDKIAQILCFSKNALQVRLTSARQRLKKDLAEIIED